VPSSGTQTPGGLKVELPLLLIVTLSCQPLCSTCQRQSRRGWPFTIRRSLPTTQAIAMIFALPVLWSPLVFDVTSQSVLIQSPTRMTVVGPTLRCGFRSLPRSNSPAAAGGTSASEARVATSAATLP
jgi:hypothetical protein